MTFAVFDERRPIDLSGLRDDPLFGAAVVSLYPSATVLRVARRPGLTPALSLTRAGWVLSLSAAIPRTAPLAGVVADRAMSFATASAARVVAIADVGTGGTLLVGTMTGPGQGVPVERRTPEFILPPTTQGLVVEPLSDAIVLRVMPAGFVLSGGPDGLALSPPRPMDGAMTAASGLTRVYGFPRQTTEDLVSREKSRAVAAAAAAMLARGPKRHALAESMIALGLGAEAQTLSRITMQDDPGEAASPTMLGLDGIAAMLASRPAEAYDLSDPRLTGTDEIAMWRALRTAMTDEASPAAAAVLATTAPLLFTYPAGLRRRFLPLAMETMIRCGHTQEAASLLAERPRDPGLAFARAMLAEARGDRDGALAQYDALTDTRSDFDHARAAVRAAELRLTMGKLDNRAAADALEAHSFAWRGDRRDLDLRLRIAELRAKHSGWRQVLEQLRGARADFPDQAAMIDQKLKEAFAAVPRDPSLDKMPPTELIALLDENAELLPDGQDGEPMRALLAQKLMALDLPKQADPVLTRLMRAAAASPTRASFGARLAMLRLGEDNADGAIAALSESVVDNPPDAMREQRSLIMARARAKRGDVAGAVRGLSDDTSQDADETRAAILEQAGDWPAARDALARLAVHVIPEAGALNDVAVKLALRLATAATHADDDATLASLREKLGSRLGNGRDADLFRLLTAAPVRGISDLGRAKVEIGLARALTASTQPGEPAAAAR